MAIKASDISFVLSGGSNNANPYLSLGGDPSGYPITGTLNNLFDNVTMEESTAGNVDYRCIYVFNDHATDPLYETRLYLENQVSGGSTIEIGIWRNTDVQKLNFYGVPNSGHLFITYEDQQVRVDFNADLAVLGQNIQNALNSLPVLSGVVVSTKLTPNLQYTVRFMGNDDNRRHPILQLENFMGGVSSIAVSKLSHGSPINAIASQITNEHTTPSGITFSNPTASSPIVLGTIHPGDGVPVWVKRTTPVNADPLATDGFTLAIKGSPVGF